MTDVFASEPSEIAREISKLVQLGGRLKAVSEQDSATANYQKALAAYDNALRETVTYMEQLKTGQIEHSFAKEGQLAELWSVASIAISDFDPHLAKRCFIKGQGWLSPAVWQDERYKEFHIGIDDMRQALMDLQDKHFAEAKNKIPNWFPIVGALFAAAGFLTLIFLLLGADLSPRKAIVLDAFMALCVAASSAFLGGAATASGTLKVPFMKEAPIAFTATTGIAVFIVVLILMVTFNH